MHQPYSITEFFYKRMFSQEDEEVFEKRLHTPLCVISEAKLLWNFILKNPTIPLICSFSLVFPSLSSPKLKLSLPCPSTKQNMACRPVTYLMLSLPDITALKKIFFKFLFTVDLQCYMFMYSKVTHIYIYIYIYICMYMHMNVYIYIYILFFIFFSIMVCHRILNIVSCAVQ